MASNKYKIAIALGGGAARGYAHIGALRALIEAKIPFDILLGCSAGALIGGVYAITPNIDWVEKRFLEFLKWEGFQESFLNLYQNLFLNPQKDFKKRFQKFFARTNLMRKFFFTPALMDRKEGERIISYLLPPIHIEDTVIPFACVAVDMLKGREVVFTRGEIRPRVLASAAMPTVFPPVAIEGSLYLDGGILDKICIEAARKLRIPYVIAIDVSNSSLSKNFLRNGLDIMRRIEEIGAFYRKDYQLLSATFVIQPIEGEYHWADFSRVKEFIERGYEVTRSKIPAIRDFLKIPSPFRKFFSFFRREKGEKIRWSIPVEVS